MDDSTAPLSQREQPKDDTTPNRTRPAQARETAPHRIRRQVMRRRPNWGWRLVALVLGIAVGLNLCLTTGFWLYKYTFAGADASPAPGTPAQPGAQPATSLPALDPTAGPTPTLPSLPPTFEPPPTTGVVTVLMLGIDERPDQANEPTRSDTLMVLRVDFDHGTARLLSFPRDMWVALPGLEAYGVTANRINTAYFYGERYELPGGGPALAMQTVTLNFGIRIDHYARVSFDGFVNTVDALGGIDIDVPEAIFDDQFPTDDYGTVLFSVPAGLQHMDGLTALRYARTRHQDSDFERIRRQQAVLLAVRDKAVTLDAVRNLPELIAIAGDSFSTDMTLPQMVTYAYGAQRIQRDRIETFVIDENYLIGWSGAGGASLYIPDRQKIAVLVEQFLRDE